MGKRIKKNLATITIGDISAKLVTNRNIQAPIEFLYIEETKPGTGTYKLLNSISSVNIEQCHAICSKLHCLLDIILNYKNDIKKEDYIGVSSIETENILTFIMDNTTIELPVSRVTMIDSNSKSFYIEKIESTDTYRITFSINLLLEASNLSIIHIDKES